MAVQLSQSDFQRLVRIIQNQPAFGSQADRQNLVTLAFGTSGRADMIRAQLNLSGSPMSAAVELARFLATFGQVEPGVEALGLFLDQLLLNLGLSDDADFMAEIIHRYQLVNPPAPQAPAAIPQPAALPSAAGLYVFISYARPQQPIAQQVETYLTSAGFRVFRDTRDIRTGDNWDMAIETALNDATHMVLLLSASSMPYRKEVHREWFYFDQQRKPILPLYVQECTLHSRMMAYNYIDATNDLPTALAKLVAELA